MGNGKNIIIKDENMYEYFDTLIFDKEKSKLKPEWQRQDHAQGYGFTERNVAALLGSKKLLYDREDAEKQVCLLETLEKFLHEFVGIGGLEELFINNYGEIENNIFLEHDSLGQSRNIREHAKHQIKNAYLGSVLLLDCGYLKNMAENVCRKQSPVTQYLYAEAEQFLNESKRRIATVEKAVEEKLQELCYKIFMVSSLLHDIGYPLTFYLRAAKQMTDYPPYLKILTPTVKADFSELKSYLLESRLFRMIGSDAVRAKYEQEDHGVLSALSLLMHFYHNGKIYALTREERCIIEMSAIAIYCHTDRFTSGKRMVYLTDPISYMVRLCDDLQEWDRFKLSINEKHNFLQCGNCGRRVKEDGGNYECECGQTYKKITMINNRKLNYICLCDEFEIKSDKSKTQVIAKFHLMKQLEILLENYAAVLKIEKDLERVRDMISNQTVTPPLEIDFLSPITR